MPTYTWPFLPRLVQLTSLRERNVSSHFFSRSKLSEVCHISYWRESLYGTFQLIFRWFLLFCVDFSVSDFQHRIGCDGSFIYCWMSCLDLKNINQILPLQLLCFLRFVVCGIVRWPYTARISLDFPVIWRIVFFLLFTSFILHNIHFSALDNPPYSPLLGRPKMKKMMGQTSVQHSLLFYVDKFLMRSSRDLWRFFP